MQKAKPFREEIGYTSWIPVLEKMDIFLKELAVGRRSFDDTFFEDGDKACSLFKRMCVYDIDEEELCHNVSKEFSCEVPGCMSTFETLLEFEVHYNTLHRYVCSVCKKILPSPHFLDLHIEENHDSFFSLQAEQKPMYQCLVEDCKTRFWTTGERKDHCLKTHSFPPNFRWFVHIKNIQKAKSKSSKLKPKKNVDTEMTENRLELKSAEADMEECLQVKTPSQPSGNKSKKKQGKKQGNKVVDMELDSENNAGSAAVQELIASEQLQVVQKSKKSPAPFKGFIPRNVNANRAFHQKSYLKGRDWHQTALPSTLPTSLLESGNLSVDLRGSLPTDMEEM